MTAVEVVRLGVCGSTQADAHALLDERGEGAVVIVLARAQVAGRGRAGRRWQQPPGEALLMSVGANGPLPVSVLDQLARRSIDTLLAAIDDAAPGHRVCWRAPNDLVDESGRKLGGVLVDARTTGVEVDRLVIGVGLNLSGPHWHTDDGRAASSLLAAAPHADLDRIRATAPDQFVKLITLSA